jgi:uncharacterized protein YbaR (Trm112 family)
MIDSDLLNILCCPETHQDLQPAEGSLVDKLNELITAGRMKNRGGEIVTEKLEQGWVRADGKLVYPVRRSLPIMLVDEALPLG